MIENKAYGPDWRASFFFLPAVSILIYQIKANYLAGDFSMVIGQTFVLAAVLYMWTVATRTYTLIQDRLIIRGLLYKQVLELNTIESIAPYRYSSNLSIQFKSGESQILFIQSKEQNEFAKELLSRYLTKEIYPIRLNPSATETTIRLFSFLWWLGLVLASANLLLSDLPEFTLFNLIGSFAALYIAYRKRMFCYSLFQSLFSSDKIVGEGIYQGRNLLKFEDLRSAKYEWVTQTKTSGIELRFKNRKRYYLNFWTLIKYPFLSELILQKIHQLPQRQKIYRKMEATFAREKRIRQIEYAVAVPLCLTIGLTHKAAELAGQYAIWTSFFVAAIFAVIAFRITRSEAKKVTSL